MAVPNTNTFSFQDVCTEIYGYYAAGMNLVQAFTDAIGTFDPTYVGSKNGLLCFRNYSHVPADMRLILHFVSVNTNTTKLDFEFVIQNGTVSDHNVSVRISNVSKGSANFTIYSGTIYANTQSSNIIGLSTNMGVTNDVGNAFSIEMDIDSANTWDGVIQAQFPFILNYDWTL